MSKSGVVIVRHETRQMLPSKKKKWKPIHIGMEHILGKLLLPTLGVINLKSLVLVYVAKDPFIMKNRVPIFKLRAWRSLKVSMTVKSGAEKTKTFQVADFFDNNFPGEKTLKFCLGQFATTARKLVFCTRIVKSLQSSPLLQYSVSLDHWNGTTFRTWKVFKYIGKFPDSLKAPDGLRMA